MESKINRWIDSHSGDYFMIPIDCQTHQLLGSTVPFLSTHLIPLPPAQLSWMMSGRFTSEEHSLQLFLYVWLLWWWWIHGYIDQYNRAISVINWEERGWDRGLLLLMTKTTFIIVVARSHGLRSVHGAGKFAAPDPQQQVHPQLIRGF